MNMESFFSQEQEVPLESPMEDPALPEPGEPYPVNDPEPEPVKDPEPEPVKVPEPNSENLKEL